MKKTRSARAGMRVAEWPAEGYFLALVREHNWPPMWEPRTTWGQSAVLARDRATAARDRRQERGITDTIVGLSVKSDQRAKSTRAAGWMK